MILFLDFDGVLHPEKAVAMDLRTGRPEFVGDSGESLFMYAPALEKALADFPEVKIVLSTFWAFRFPFTFARDQLPDGLRSRVIGDIYLPESVRIGHTRYDQIATYVKRTGLATRDWIALDDCDDWPAKFANSLVHCRDPQRGISHPEVITKLVRALGEQP